MLRISVVVLVIAAFALAAAASQSPAPDPARVEAKLLGAANEFRADNGLAPLAPNERLSADARGFADYLARTNTFSHTADGREPAQRAEAAGYDYCNLAENLAYEVNSSGVSLDRLVRLLMAGWEASPGHRRNLLEPEVTETGVGVARAPGDDQKYVAVQVFGRPISARYSFSVENRTGAAVRYSFAGERRRLGPRSTVVHTTCADGALDFDGDISPAARHYAVRPNAAYVLTDGRWGVQIEVRHRTRPAGGPDED